jgi:hypothetical protein
MAIEDWESEPSPSDIVDDPRRHTLGGFRPGEGFSASSTDDDETLTSLEFEKDDDTLEKASSGSLDALVAELWKP